MNSHSVNNRLIDIMCCCFGGPGLTCFGYFLLFSFVRKRGGGRETGGRGGGSVV